MSKKDPISPLNKKANKNLLFRILFVILAFYAIGLFLPLLWGLMTSFKTDFDLMNEPFKFPAEWRFDNYSKIWDGIKVSVRLENGGQKTVNLVGLLVNSLLYSLGATALSILFPFLVAYASAKFSKYRFCRFLYAFNIIVMIFPVIGSLPSELTIVKALNFYDNIFWLCILKGTVFGMHFLMFYASFKSLPSDYGDAARVDGASEYTILFRIMMPLSKGVMLAIGMLSFITFWNEYTTTLVYLPSYPTLAYGLFNLRESYDPIGSQTTIRIAGCFILTLPIFLLFLVANKFFMQNLGIGGLKG